MQLGTLWGLLKAWIFKGEWFLFLIEEGLYAIEREDDQGWR